MRKERQTGALIAQVSMIIAMAQAILEQLEDSGECQHPESGVINMTTFGADEERWRCKACGTEANNKHFDDDA